MLSTSPRMPLSRVQKFCIHPGSATVSAHGDLSHLGLPCPRGSENCVYLVPRESFVNPWPGYLGLHLHLSQRAAHGFCIQILPISVVRCLPVTLKRLSYRVDSRQPLDGSHSIMTGHNRAHRIAMIGPKIAAIHFISDQNFPLNCFVPGQATGVRDRNRRHRRFFRCSVISSFEHDLQPALFSSVPLPQKSQKPPALLPPPHTASFSPVSSH